MADDRDEWPEAPAPIGAGPDPGEYTLAYKSGRIVPNRFGRRVAEISFRIVDEGRWFNTALIMYCAIPKDRPASPRSKYYRMWVLANGAPPKRGDRMTPRIFEGPYWRAKVGRTEQATDGADGVRKLKDGEVGVSLVEYLIKREAGAVKKMAAARAKHASVAGNGVPQHEMRGAEKR